MSTTAIPSPQPGDSLAGQPRGLMYVEVDYPLDGVAEFHDWYNNEHIPERGGTPGFVTAHRYAAIEGGARWLAVYELDTPAVLESEAYLYCKGVGETAWTRRMALSSRDNYRRTVCELLWSGAGQASSATPVGPPGLFSLRMTANLTGDESELQALLACPGLGRVRLYRDLDNPAETLLLADLQGIWAVQSPEFRQAWTGLVARLNAQSATYARGVQVRIL